MNKLTKLLEEYRELQDSIHTNRATMKRVLKDSQGDRIKLIQVKTKMLTELKKYKSVYDFCIKQFGKVDWRFHALYYLSKRKSS